MDAFLVFLFGKEGVFVDGFLLGLSEGDALLGEEVLEPLAEWGFQEGGVGGVGFTHDGLMQG